MNTPRRQALLMGLLAAAATLGLAGCAKDPAPESTFVLLDGARQSTADLKGKVTLVNFWATSCTTCVAEMPQIVATYNQYKGKGYDTLAVAMSYDPPAYVVNYAETRKLPFKVAIDNTGAAYTWETYPERLQRAGISWRVYQEEDDYGDSQNELNVIQDRGYVSLEAVDVLRQADDHHVHREERAQPEPYQKPRRLPFLARLPRYLAREKAAVAAEGAPLRFRAVSPGREAAVRARRAVNRHVGCFKIRICRESSRRIPSAEPHGRR